jgi:prevent-host-death family protein
VFSPYAGLAERTCGLMLIRVQLPASGRLCLTADTKKTRLLTSHMSPIRMKSWPVQDAKSRFSEFLKASLTEGPQVVTLRGVETAVLVPMQEWRSLHARARPTLKALLLSQEARGGLNLQPRGHLRRRTPRAED